MNTIIIFSDFQNSPVFFTVEGDYTHLNEVYIGEATDTTELQNELNDLIQDLDPSVDFPVGLFYNETETTPVVITCGFIP